VALELKSIASTKSFEEEISKRKFKKYLQGSYLNGVHIIRQKLLTVYHNTYNNNFQLLKKIVTNSVNECFQLKNVCSVD